VREGIAVERREHLGEMGGRLELGQCLLARDELHARGVGMRA
jgi:hypothetical protein